MKVIDLLNKIANGEDTPDRFIYDGMLFERHLDNYYQHYDIGKTYSNIVQFTDEICSDYSNLNDEVEIIEDTSKEDKKIDRVSLLDVNTDYKLKDILNEIIDKINGGENERNK